MTKVINQGKESKARKVPGQMEKCPRKPAAESPRGLPGEAGSGGCWWPFLGIGAIDSLCIFVYFYPFHRTGHKNRGSDKGRHRKTEGKIVILVILLWVTKLDIYQLIPHMGHWAWLLFNWLELLFLGYWWVWGEKFWFFFLSKWV